MTIRGKEGARAVKDGIQSRSKSDRTRRVELRSRYSLSGQNLLLYNIRPAVCQADCCLMLFPQRYLAIRCSVSPDAE